MRQLFNALVFLVVFLLGCQSNNSKVPLNGPKRSVTNIKRGTLEFYVDAFTIAACKSNGQYNIAMLVRLANNTNDTIAVPSSKQAIFNDGIGTFPSYIEGTLYGQKVRFRQMGGDEQIPPHGDIMLELFLDNFRPVPQSIYMIEDVICCDSIRSMSLDYVYKPSESDKLNTCRYIHFNAMQNAAFAVAPSDLAFLHITQNLRAIPELFEGSANHEGQANIMCEKGNWGCADNGMLDCHVGKVFVSAQKQHGRYNLAMSTVIWNNSTDTVWLPMRKDEIYQETVKPNVFYVNAVLLDRTAQIGMWPRTNYIPPYDKVRVVLFLENFDVAKGKCSNEKTIYENSMRNISLKYYYHPLSMDDPCMCKGIRFHVGHRTRLVVVPSNLGCGEIPLSCQKVYKGEPIDY